MIFFLLSGCATSTSIVGPDGSEHQLVKCETVDYCYEKAREVCGGNYKIVNSNTVTNGNNGNVSTNTNILIKCEN